MQENNKTEQERHDAITLTLEAQRRRLVFVRSTLFFGAGTLLTVVLTAHYLLRQLAGYGSQIWMFFALLIVGIGLLGLYYRRHRTITASDRVLMNTWCYAMAVCLYTGFYVNQDTQSEGYPLFGFIAVGASIAVGVTSEIYRINSTNRSQLRGSLVVLNTMTIIGAFLSSWIFITARNGAHTASFVLSLITIALLLFGTGAVVRYNELRNHV